MGHAGLYRNIMPVIIIGNKHRHWKGERTETKKSNGKITK